MLFQSLCNIFRSRYEYIYVFRRGGLALAGRGSHERGTGSESGTRRFWLLDACVTLPFRGLGVLLFHNIFVYAPYAWSDGKRNNIMDSGNTSTIACSSVVQRGDPMGPAMICLAL